MGFPVLRGQVGQPCRLVLQSSVDSTLDSTTAAWYMFVAHSVVLIVAGLGRGSCEDTCHSISALSVLLPAGLPMCMAYPIILIDCWESLV